MGLKEVPFPCRCSADAAANRDGLWEGFKGWPAAKVRAVESQWNPKSSLRGSWLLPTEQGMDLCCPHGLVKCPTSPLTPLCRWTTLVLLNKAAISQLLELGGFVWPGWGFWGFFGWLLLVFWFFCLRFFVGFFGNFVLFLFWVFWRVIFVFLFLLWHSREIYRNNIKRPESGGDGCAELTTGPRICQAGIYYSRGGDSYVKIKLKSQQWNCIKADNFQAASQ